MIIADVKKRLSCFRGDQQGVEVKRMSLITGLSERTIRRYLDPDDAIVPSLGFIVAVCRHYGLSMDQLILSGAHIVDTDVNHKWSVFMSWWSANLTQDEKVALMLALRTVWAKAVDAVDKNANLKTELHNHKAPHKIP